MRLSGLSWSGGSWKRWQLGLKTAESRSIPKHSLAIWDEGEGSGEFSDGPIGMLLLSPFAKGGGKKAFSNTIHYDHSSTLKTFEEIFGVEPLLGAAANPKTKDLSDFFKGTCGDRD